jgi:hypothetical protein
VLINADSIIFLLGAGASKEAGIPISTMMIDNVENLLNSDYEWKSFKELYYCLKSSILHGFGINGEYNKNLLNIETLVNTMEELTKSIKHPIYPFVGSWIPRLTELTKNNFEMIEEFRRKIIAQLFEWMKHEQNEYIEYFKGFLRFQREWKNIVRIFTLNYDLCVEESCSEGNINRGIDNSTHTWNWKNFENEENGEFNIILYKLHGSRDWFRDDSGLVKERRNNIENKEAALIFGTAYKLQYLDPFLYLIYEFRRRTLDPKTTAIICIGYSFGDEHINGIIAQSITDNPKRRIIVVSPADENKTRDKQKQITNKLKIALENNITIIPLGAKEFLQEKLSVQYIENFLPKDEQPF